MNILFIVSNIEYPPKDGLYKQLSAVFRHFSAKHTCYVTGFIKEDSPFDSERLKEDMPGLVLGEFIRYVGNYGSLSARVMRQRKALKKRFLGQFPQADVIHLDHIPLAPLVTVLKKEKTLLSVVDAISLRQKLIFSPSFPGRLISYAKYTYSRLLEKRYFPRAGAVHVVSEAEAGYYRGLGHSNIRRIPVGYHLCLEDTDYSQEMHGSAKVLLWGNMAVPYLKETALWFLKEVWPKIRKEFPELTLNLLSPVMPGEGVLALCDDSVNPVIWVEDLESFVRQHRAVFLPDLKGTGIKNRTLDVINASVPLIGSERAVEGLGLEPADHYLPVDSADSALEGLRAVTENYKAMKAMCASASRYIRDSFSFATVMKLWEEAYGSEGPSEQNEPLGRTEALG